MENPRPLKSFLKTLKLESHIFFHFSSYSLGKNKNKNKNLLQCEKYAFVFSAAYVCQNQKKNLFSNVMINQSVQCLYLIDLEHQCLWTHFILKQSKNKGDYLLVACRVSCPLNSKQCIPTLSLELILGCWLGGWVYGHCMQTQWWITISENQSQSSFWSRGWVYDPFLAKRM